MLWGPALLVDMYDELYEIMYYEGQTWCIFGPDLSMGAHSSGLTMSIASGEEIPLYVQVLWYYSTTT